jgi:hypothetical protein
MATRVSARLTPAEGRAFALSLAGAFTAIAALFWWQGGGAPMWAAGSLAALLLLAGLTIPTRLRPALDAWMRLALVLSRITTPIVMGIVFYLVITPIGALLRALGKDPLRRTVTGTGYLIHRSARPGHDMERQF